MQNRWRVMARPAQALVLNSAHPSVQSEFILRQTENFYEHSFATLWKPMLERDPTAFSSQTDFEVFTEALISAAVLVEAGQTTRAAEVVQNTVDFLTPIVLQCHPVGFYVLILLCFHTSNSAHAQLCLRIRTRLAEASEQALGREHPLTKILQLQIPITSRPQLQIAMMERLQDWFRQNFGTDAMQYMNQSLCFARVQSAVGNTDDALRLITGAVATAERSQGLNSVAAAYMMMEKVSICLARNPPEISILPELYLSDVFRRLQVLALELAKTPAGSEDAQKLEVAIVHAKMAALRLFGQLHVLRKNYGSAIQTFTEAVEYADEKLGPDSILAHVLRSDLDAARMEELKVSMDRISVSSIDGVDPPTASREAYNTAHTVVGSITSINRNYLGRRSQDIPLFQGMMIGFTLEGSPAMCHAVVR
jgi:hypothetical protein